MPEMVQHTTSVAVPETHAVNALGAADVGRTIACQRNGFVGGSPQGMLDAQSISSPASRSTR